MTHIMIPSPEVLLELQGKWLSCDGYLNLPPMKMPVPIVIRGRLGSYIYIPAAQWVCDSQVPEGIGVSLERLLELQRSIKWYTVFGKHIPVPVYAWYIVPNFNPSEVIER